MDEKLDRDDNLNLVLIKNKYKEECEIKFNGTT